MASLRARKRQGFSLIELLVTIAIICILIGLLLVSIQNVRQTAYRIQCANNLHNLGLAFHNYHLTNKAFPTENKAAQAPNGVSFYLQLLPYVEQKNAADAYAKSNSAPMPTVKEFLCPARRSVAQVQAKRDYGYAMSLGSGMQGPAVLDNVDPVPLSTIVIGKGSANTALLTHVWMDPTTYISGDATDQGYVTKNNGRYATTPVKEDRDSTGNNSFLGGPHPHVLPTLFVDGRVDNIAYGVYGWQNDNSKGSGSASGSGYDWTNAWTYTNNPNLVKNCQGWYDNTDTFAKGRAQCANCNNYCKCGCIPPEKLALQLLHDKFMSGAMLTAQEQALLAQLSNAGWNLGSGNEWTNYQNFIRSSTDTAVSSGQTLTAAQQQQWALQLGSATQWNQVSSDTLQAIRDKAAKGGTLTAQEQSILDSYNAYQASIATTNSAISKVGSGGTLTSAEQTAWNTVLSNSGGNFYYLSQSAQTALLNKARDYPGSLTSQEQALLNNKTTQDTNAANAAAQNALNNSAINAVGTGNGGQPLNAAQQQAWNNLLGSAQTWNGVSSSVLTAIQNKAGRGETLTSQEQNILNSYNTKLYNDALPGNTYNAINSNQTLTADQQTYWNTQITNAGSSFYSLSQSAQTALRNKATNSPGSLTPQEQTLYQNYQNIQATNAWNSSVISKAQSGQTLNAQEQTYYNSYLAGQSNGTSSGASYTSSSTTQTGSQTTMNSNLANVINNNSSGSGASCGCGFPCCPAGSCTCKH